MSQTQLFLFDNKDSLIKTRHSFYENRSPNESVPTSKCEAFSKSDINIIRTTDFPSIIDSGCVNRRISSVNDTSSGEYYKNYEHDEVPVRDSSSRSNDLSHNEVVSCDTKELTNSDLDKLEIRIYKNMSKELQTDESSADTREYNIKLFKTTVLEILDKFYSNVQDFEVYKEKFYDILSKNKENLVDEMEDFIKDMIQNIVSSESCMSSEIDGTKNTSNKMGTEVTFGDESRTLSLDTGDCKISTQKTVEAYKNENYLTDSTFDDETAKMHKGEKKSCNIYLLKGNPCVEIKMDGRHLLSEINIRNQHPEEIDQIASADNVKSVAAKQLQITKYMKQAERQSSDKIIPVKISYAKKNIHSEDNPDEFNDTNKSFIYKICNFLCKKLRKTSLG